MTDEPMTRKGRERRESLIGSATRLFRDAGFEGVGVDDIAEASGISGPGVYRYFASKQAILLAVVEEPIIRLRDGAVDIEKRLGPGREALRTLIARHAEQVVHGDGSLQVYHEVQKHLSPLDRARLRRLMSEYVAVWIRSLLAASPAIDVEDARIAAHGLTAFINSFPTYRSNVTLEHAQTTLTSMCLLLVDQLTHLPAS